jgi:hypothetical protein
MVSVQTMLYQVEVRQHTGEAKGKQENTIGQTGE